MAPRATPQEKAERLLNRVREALKDLSRLEGLTPDQIKACEDGLRKMGDQAFAVLRSNDDSFSLTSEPG